MHYLPISLRVLRPPQDDLQAALEAATLQLQERDVVIISSKVVSIAEGNCFPMAGTDKQQLVVAEADIIIPRTYWSSPLTIKHGAFIGNAGIDESNADGHYCVLPKDPFHSAKFWYDYFSTTHSITELGVVIVDSHATPLRRGALGIALGWWGIAPTISHVGKADLFGRAFKAEVTNVVDALAAGAVLAMGETDESTPVVIVRGVPKLTFTTADTKADVLVPSEQDTFRVLYDSFLT